MPFNNNDDINSASLFLLIVRSDFTESPVAHTVID